MHHSTWYASGSHCYTILIHSPLFKKGGVVIKLNQLIIFFKRYSCSITGWIRRESALGINKRILHTIMMHTTAAALRGITLRHHALTQLQYSTEINIGNRYWPP